MCGYKCLFVNASIHIPTTAKNLSSKCTNQCHKCTELCERCHDCKFGGEFHDCAQRRDGSCQDAEEHSKDRSEQDADNLQASTLLWVPAATKFRLDKLVFVIEMLQFHLDKEE